MTYALPKLYMIMLLLGCFVTATAVHAKQTKRMALIIGIGQYQPGNGWKNIHGDYDVEVIKHTLLHTGFIEKNIFSLMNEQATKKGILAALNTLLNAVDSGDIVVVHFSGHGQQLSDMDRDEADGRDEALVPYDAPAAVKEGEAYRGEKHLIDDELFDWFTALRKKVGPTGQLVVFIDACHSGTLSRGNGLARGDVSPIIFNSSTALDKRSSKQEEGSGYWQPGSTNNNRLGKLMLYAAASANDINHEYREKEMGSLTYAIADALETKMRSPHSSYRDLFEFIRNTMAIIVPGQIPQLEGDKDVQVFGGDWMVQEPFYRVSEINKAGLLEVAGGTLLGIDKGASIGLFPIGTRHTNGAPVVKGKVEQASPLKCQVRLERSLPNDSAVRLQAFMLSPLFSYAPTTVLIGKVPPGLLMSLKKLLTLHNISLVDNIALATLVVDTNANGLIELQRAADRTPAILPVNAHQYVTVPDCNGQPAGSLNVAEYLADCIADYARYNIIRNITLSDKDLGVSVRLVKAATTSDAAQVDTGQSSVFTAQSQALLTYENTGSRPGYFYLVELGPTGNICPLMGFDTEIMLNPHELKQLKLDGFNPPFGKYVVKAYITDEPIGDELLWRIKAKSGQVRTKGNTSSLISLFDKLIQTPGSKRSPSMQKGGRVYIANYAYEIKEN